KFHYVSSHHLRSPYSQNVLRTMNPFLPFSSSLVTSHRTLAHQLLAHHVNGESHSRRYEGSSDYSHLEVLLDIGNLRRYLTVHVHQDPSLKYFCLQIRYRLL